MSRQSPDAVADTLNSLSHRRRVLIFRTLQKDATTGNSFARLAQITGFCESSLSHHLRVMERSGILKRSKRGAISEYRLTTTGFGHTLETLLAECSQSQRRVSKPSEQQTPPGTTESFHMNAVQQPDRPTDQPPSGSFR